MEMSPSISAWATSAEKPIANTAASDSFPLENDGLDGRAGLPALISLIGLFELGYACLWPVLGTLSASSVDVEPALRFFFVIAAIR